MAGNQYVGSTSVRLATLGVVFITMSLAALVDSIAPYRSYVVIAGSVLTFIGVVHSSRALFERWMIVAETLQTIVVTTIFTVTYLLVVPVFAVVMWFVDPLSLSRRSRRTTWIQRKAGIDAESLERMG
jgi:hypothetical protein